MVSFSLKNCKNRQKLELYLQTLLPPTTGGSGPVVGGSDPQTPASVILHSKLFSLHLSRCTNSRNRKNTLYVLVIIARVHQAFRLEEIMQHYLC